MSLRGEREAWDDLYAKRGIQFGGAGDLKPLLERLRPGMKVLEVGCGEGKSLEILARFYEVVGCDFSREALSRLAGRVDHASDVNLVESDMRSLPFVDEKFDAVASVHSLSHMFADARQTAAHEMRRVLRPGGVVFVEAFDLDDLRYGSGSEVEENTFLGGNGIVTHYFGEGEVAALFPRIKSQKESHLSRRIVFGATAGKRSVVRVVMEGSHSE